MSELEAVKKLEEAARDCMKSLKGMSLRESSAKTSIKDLEAKAVKLKKEVDELEAEKKSLSLKINQDRRSQIEEIIRRQEEASKMQSELNSQLNVNSGLKAEYERKQQLADEAKIKYDKLVVEYEIRMKDLKEKQEKVNSIVG